MTQRVHQYGDRLRAWRQAAGITQEEAGARLGLTKRGYQAIENGFRQVGLERLRTFANVTGIPLETFIP